MNADIQPLRPDAPFVGADGKLTPEGYDYLFNMFKRLGGSTGEGLDDAFVRIATAPSVVAANAVTTTRVDGLDFRANIPKTSYVPWERPGAIGRFTPNTGTFTTGVFTTVQAKAPSYAPGSGYSGSFESDGTNACQIQFGGNEAGGYTWQRSLQQNVGAVPHRFYLNATNYLTVSTSGITVVGDCNVNGQLVSTVATGTPPLSVTSTTLVPNLFVDLSNFANAMTNPIGIAATATDPASTQALANSIRSILLSKNLAS